MKKTFALMLVLLTLVLLNGCFDFMKTKKPPQKTQNPKKLQSIQDFEKNTKNQTIMIRGILVKEEYIAQEGRWHCQIQELDKTSNTKTPRIIKFYSNGHKFSVGDLVYAIIKNNHLKNMYIITKKYTKLKGTPQKSYIVKTPNSKKRTKDKTNKNIKPPASELINLN